MNQWQRCYFAFYDLGIALGPISRSTATTTPSSSSEARDLLFGPIAEAVGAFVAGGLVAPPPPSAQCCSCNMADVAARWRLVTDCTQRACRNDSDRYSWWHHCGRAAWRCAVLLRGLQSTRNMLPDELRVQIAQTLALSTFAGPAAVSQTSEPSTSGCKEPTLRGVGDLENCPPTNSQQSTVRAAAPPGSRRLKRALSPAHA